jgi:hypothetical protein
VERVATRIARHESIPEVTLDDFQYGRSDFQQRDIVEESERGLLARIVTASLVTRSKSSAASCHQRRVQARRASACGLLRVV